MNAAPAVGRLTRPRPVSRAGGLVPEGWRGLPAAQQPRWPDPAALAAVADTIATAPPLVFAGECDQLRDQLAQVARGEAFLLQGGACAETFADVTADAVSGTLQTILQMAVLLTYGAAVPVVKTGRLAGQFAKPRSQDTEARDGVRLPSYRGDMVNDAAFTAAARTPDPQRLLRAYQASAATLNLVRAFTHGGFADLRQVHAWNRDFVRDSPEGERYELVAKGIDRALAFMGAWRAEPAASHVVDVYAGHEALILDYEHALTRIDSRTGLPYDLSGHFLWIGERTRALDGAHVEFLRRVRNPIGVKLGPTTTSDEAVALLERLDPEREPGRLTFITRLGAGGVRDLLPPLVEKVTAEGGRPVWVCDPMHGNTFEAADGHKTRRFDDILDETEGFFDVHRGLGTHPGGIHIELTGDNVTECIGGGHPVAEDDLRLRYTSVCDPRLNRGQALDLAFRVAELCRRAEDR